MRPTDDPREVPTPALPYPDDAGAPQARTPGDSFSVFGAVIWGGLIFFAVTDPRGRLLLVAIGLYHFVTLLHISAFALVGWWRGATIEQFSLGLGGRFVRVRAGGIDWRLNGIPAGGYVKFLSGNGDDNPSHDSRALVHGPPGSFTRLHPLTRVLLWLSGPALVLAFAAVVLGPARAGHSLVAGFQQLVLAPLPPGDAAVSLLRRFFALIADGRLVVAAALLAAKVTAFNLLPIPTSNGGNAILQFVEWVIRRPLPGNVRGLLQVGGMSILLLLGLMWLYAMIKFMNGR